MAFEIITFTNAAVERIGEILDNKPEGKGIRIGVKNGGCAGMEYTVDLVGEPDPKDDKVTTPKGDVYIAPQAVLFLLGTQLDFEITKLRTGFVFNNPNQSSACGCGESVELTPAEMTPELLQARQEAST